MPRALGDSFLHVDDIDFLVPVNYPILEAAVGVPDEMARLIGKQSRAWSRTGRPCRWASGRSRSSVLYYLKDKKDLGVHTEMFSDGMMHLVELGVITNMKKTLHKGKVVAAFCMGSRKLYDFVDNNPFIEFHPVSHTNDPFVIAQNDRMVSINIALEIDLTGQVCADSPGGLLLLGHRRAGRFHTRRRPVARRQADHRAALDGLGRQGLADHGPAQARRRGRDEPRRCPLRRDRVRGSPTCTAERSRSAPSP